MRQFFMLVCALSLVPLTTELRAQDAVTVTSGPQRKGRILRDDIKGIKIRVLEGGGATAEIEAGMIIDVKYVSAPPALGDARELLKAGQFKTASLMFQQVLEVRNLDDKIKQYGFFYLAECQMRTGSAAAARFSVRTGPRHGPDHLHGLENPSVIARSAMPLTVQPRALGGPRKLSRTHPGFRQRKTLSRSSPDRRLLASRA